MAKVYITKLDGQLVFHHGSPTSSTFEKRPSGQVFDSRPRPDGIRFYDTLDKTLFDGAVTDVYIRDGKDGSYTQATQDTIDDLTDGVGIDGGAGGLVKTKGQVAAVAADADSLPAASNMEVGAVGLTSEPGQADGAVKQYKVVANEGAANSWQYDKDVAVAEGDVYKSSVDGNLYVWTGVAWEIMPDNLVALNEKIDNHEEDEAAHNIPANYYNKPQVDEKLQQLLTSLAAGMDIQLGNAEYLGTQAQLEALTGVAEGTKAIVSEQISGAWSSATYANGAWVYEALDPAPTHGMYGIVTQNLDANAGNVGVSGFAVYIDDGVRPARFDFADLSNLMSGYVKSADLNDLMRAWISANNRPSFGLTGQTTPAALTQQSAPINPDQTSWRSFIQANGTKLQWGYLNINATDRMTDSPPDWVKSTGVTFFFIQRSTYDQGQFVVTLINNASGTWIGSVLSNGDITWSPRNFIPSVSDLENINAYGIEWDTTVADSACTRIGNPDLHRSLPVQSAMRGVLMADDGTINYILGDDWSQFDLTGVSGQVMVEIPAHYRKFETSGNKRRAWISTMSLPGYHYVPKSYLGAYEAAVDQNGNKLSSVVNTTTAFRGGGNQSAWDGTYRSVLGRPRTVLSRTTFRTYARNRGSKWNLSVYEVYKSAVWLYYIEYANRNCQLPYNAVLDDNGFKQGGLGAGVTTIASSDWSTLNEYYPFVPCGVTNQLNAPTGVVNYDVDINGDGSKIVTVSVPRWRYFENFFGHIWEWFDGINIEVKTDADGGTSTIFVSETPASFSDSGYLGYENRGLMPRSEGYVKTLVFGDKGDIMPATVGGSGITYWADYFYTNTSASALRAVRFGGYASGEALAGFVYANTAHAPSYAATYIGSRLCFMPQAQS
jgi:hypothetical protein